MTWETLFTSTLTQLKMCYVLHHLIFCTLVSQDLETLLMSAFERNVIFMLISV